METADDNLLQEKSTLLWFPSYEMVFGTLFLTIIELFSEKESSLKVEKERIFGTIRVFRGSSVGYVKVQCSF